MYVRLAIAVAAHLEPEILLVDEVLAVGDIAFQKKALGKMGDVVHEGRTVLFVSHNMGAVTALCERAIWLDGGRAVVDRLAREAVAQYQSGHMRANPLWQEPDSGTLATSIEFVSVAVKNQEGALCGLFHSNEPVRIEIEFVVHRALPGCQIGARVYNGEMTAVFTTANGDTHHVAALPIEVGHYRSSFEVPGYFMMPGLYSLLVAAHLPGREVFQTVEQAVCFEVSASESLVWLDSRLGEVAPLLPWSTERIGARLGNGIAHIGCRGVNE
jgi:lipopolysaccharide transport system ATP-binding protein